jgi:hypothetical protein
MSHRMTPRSRRYRNGEDATVERTTVVRPVGGDFQIVPPDYLKIPENSVFHIGEPCVTYTVRFSDLPHDKQVMLAKKAAAMFAWDRADEYDTKDDIAREVERSYPHYMQEFAKDNAHGLFVTDDGQIVVAHYSQYRYGNVIGTIGGNSVAFNTLGFTVRKFNGQTPKKFRRSVHSGPLTVDIEKAHATPTRLVFEPNGHATYDAEPTLADYGWEVIDCAVGSESDYIFSVSATKAFGDYYATWGHNPVSNPCEFDLTRPSKVVYASLANDLAPSRAENPRGRRPRR